jgi:glycogen synthase
VRPSPAAAPGLHVLRLCSVFEPATPDGCRREGPEATLDDHTARYDPIGGMQNHTAALTRSLDSQGHRQTVLTSRLGGRRGAAALGRAARVVRTGLPIRRLRQLWGAAALPTVLRPDPASRIDVVHAHQGEDLAVLPLARLAAWRHRCPLVVTVHCSLGHTLRGRSPRALLLRVVGGWIERRALRRADAVIVLTRRAASALRADGVAPERISTVPSGYDPALFTGRSADLFPGAGRPRVGYVGRLAPQKQVDVLVHAFDRMSAAAHLVIVGDGPDRHRVRQLAGGCAENGRVTVTGFVRHTAVPAVLASLDVLVLPSAYEEMGSVLVEAMAAGLPVVGSDVGGIPEVVRDGVTGLLVPAGDVSALAAALDLLVTDPALRARLADGALTLADGYAWPELARRVAEVYGSVLARGGPVGAVR